MSNQKRIGLEETIKAYAETRERSRADGPVTELTTEGAELLSAALRWRGNRNAWDGPSGDLIKLVLGQFPVTRFAHLVARCWHCGPLQISPAQGSLFKCHRSAIIWRRRCGVRSSRGAN
jgi:hypothetical protein